MFRSGVIVVSSLAAISLFFFVIARQPHATLTSPSVVPQSPKISEKEAMQNLEVVISPLTCGTLSPDIWEERKIRQARVERNGKFYNQLLERQFVKARYSVPYKAHFTWSTALESTGKTDAQGSLVIATRLKNQFEMSLFVYDAVDGGTWHRPGYRKDNLSEIMTSKNGSLLFRLDAARRQLAVLIASLKKKVPPEFAKSLEEPPTIAKLQNAAQPLANGSLETVQNAKEQLDLGLTVYDLVKDKEKLLQLIYSKDRATVKYLVRRRRELVAEVELMKKAAR